MSYTLDEFAADCRAALDRDDGPQGRDAIRALVQRACRDDAFVASHLGPDNEAERTILYEDPDRGFCILAHVYSGPKSSNPHDHGPSWAIYGQVAGETLMTDWRLVTPPSGDRPGKVAAADTYRLAPGDAHIYHEGDLHSPERKGPTRLVRIEGMNMDGVKRARFEAV